MDSTGDTTRHIGRVREILSAVAERLENRGLGHDRSKLEEPEKSAFDEFTPKLRGSTYGSMEYQGFLADMKPALDHHYEANRHHPEHFSAGISGMTLIDLVEMLADWKAASERHSAGDVLKSIEINARRFEIVNQLREILTNTAKALWPPETTKNGKAKDGS